MSKEPMKMWVARDKDGRLFLFRTKPILLTEVEAWFECIVENEYDEGVHLPAYMFPEVTFSTGPKQVELKLVEK